MIPRAILVTLFVSLFLSAPLLASEKEADLIFSTNVTFVCIDQEGNKSPLP